MKAGVAAVGAFNNRLGELLGRTEELYTGLREMGVQVKLSAFKDLEQEPRAPKKRLGPSTASAGPSWMSDNEGVTVRSATRSWSRRVGAK